jgi:hypothetical protein
MAEVLKKTKFSEALNEILSKRDEISFLGSKKEGYRIINETKNTLIGSFKNYSEAYDCFYKNV